MLATEITTHVNDALQRFMQQYQNIPTQYTLTLHDGTQIQVSALGAFLATLVDQIQELENSAFSIDEGRQLYDGTTFPAFGAQLDGLGDLVGIARNGLPDSEYLTFIIGTIAENNSDSSIPAVVNIVSLLFQVSTFKAFEMFPAEINFQIPDSSPLPEDLYQAVSNIVQSSLGAGVGLGFITRVPATGAFKCSSVARPVTGAGTGFASLATPHGKFGKNIFNNSGV